MYAEYMAYINMNKDVVTQIFSTKILKTTLMQIMVYRMKVTLGVVAEQLFMMYSSLLVVA